MRTFPQPHPSCVCQSLKLYQASGYVPLDDGRRLAQLQLQFQRRGSKNYTWILIADSAELTLFCGNNKWGCWRQSWDRKEREKGRDSQSKAFLNNCYFQSLVFHTYCAHSGTLRRTRPVICQLLMSPCSTLASSWLAGCFSGVELATLAPHLFMADFLMKWHLQILHLVRSRLFLGVEAWKKVWVHTWLWIITLHF